MISFNFCISMTLGIGMGINHGKNYLNKVHVITLPGCHRNQVSVCRPSTPCPLQCEVGRQLSYLSNDNEYPILPTVMAFALQLTHRPSSKNILAIWIYEHSAKLVAQVRPSSFFFQRPELASCSPKIKPLVTQSASRGDIQGQRKEDNTITRLEILTSLYNYYFGTAFFWWEN